MTRSERDLVLRCAPSWPRIDPSRSCDRLAEAAGLGASAARREGPVARLAVRLRRGSEGAGRIVTAPTGDSPAAAAAPVATPAPFDWDGAADHCRTAWLRGRFLARGSLSLSGGRTHLEFVVDPTEAPVLARRLADIDLPASWRIRRGRGVVTWKSGEAVGTFLRRIGAAGGLLELEARQVSRALRGDLNRVLNAESANLQRAVERRGPPARRDRRPRGGRPARPSSRRSSGWSRARAARPPRRRSPSSRSGCDLHRSAVQRALERVEDLAVRDDDTVDRPTRRRRAPALA